MLTKELTDSIKSYLSWLEYQCKTGRELVESEKELDRLLSQLGEANKTIKKIKQELKDNSDN